MLYVSQAPGVSTPHHTHAWEYQAFITEGEGTLIVEDKEYTIRKGDAVLVPPNIKHQFQNTGSVTMSRITINPLCSMPS